MLSICSQKFSYIVEEAITYYSTQGQMNGEVWTIHKHNSFAFEDSASAVDAVGMSQAGRLSS